MIYNNSNFVDSYNNTNGKGAQNLALNELSKVLGQNKEVVIGALNEAGVNVPQNASIEGIVKAMKRNSDNPRVKKYIGTIIVASSEVGDNYDHFLGKKADGTPRAGTKFFQNIFKRKPKDPNKPKKGVFGGIFKKDETTGKRKFGNWFNKNKETINDVGSSALSGLFNRGKTDEVVSAGEYHEEKNNGAGGVNGGDEKKGMSMLTKIGIGVGVIGIIAFVVWRMNKKKK